MKQIVITLIGLLVAMTSCGNKAEDAIERNMASGVVLVQNQSYIEVVLPDGESAFFSSYDKEKGLMGYTAEEDSVEKTISYGTGFFITKRGEIATNNHIVANSITDKEIIGAVSSAVDVAKMEAYVLYKESREQYDELIAHRSDIQLAYLVDEISDYEYEQYNQVLEELKTEMDEYESRYAALNMTNMNDCEVIRHSEISIAYNDTHITNTSDFIPCVVTKTDAEHDLAVIQLKDKQTPESKHVFEVPDKDPLVNYVWQEELTKKFSEDKNGKLFMTSFNLGPLLSLTPEGVIAQFNDGHVSQKTSDHIMYSIPALPGSSGSPVVNRQGQLVAINFAGLNGTQNFNYGIRVKYLSNLINE